MWISYHFCRSQNIYFRDFFSQSFKHITVKTIYLAWQAVPKQDWICPQVKPLAWTRFLVPKALELSIQLPSLFPGLLRPALPLLTVPGLLVGSVDRDDGRGVNTRAWKPFPRTPSPFPTRGCAGAEGGEQQVFPKELRFSARSFPLEKNKKGVLVVT